jgi:bisphosphoglycerate-independent phosphoglycerate mutase (AlkP superfamily)
MGSITERWLETLNALDHHDLLIMYSILPDKAHHLIHHKNEIILLKQVYQHLYSLPLMFELKNVAFLILSDHGYLNVFDDKTGKEIEGTHSSRGFWSLNMETDVKPTTVLDFYSIIHELVSI